MNAGASAAAQAAVVGRGRWWQRALAAAGYVTPDLAQARRRAGCWEAGAEGERRTAALLAQLDAHGWRGGHDLAIPGASKANADHLVWAPSGRAFMVDSKLWHRRARVRPVGGRLAHGTQDRDRQIDTALYEARLLGRALGVPVQPVIAVHNAPVEAGGFHLRGVTVVPADRLVPLLLANAGTPNPVRAGEVLERAGQVLRQYRQ
ncbi:nuclease-related domain-containing protein [Streptomyces sp. NPDC017529]|uniref:nuclease-related domain-containing protein n=1 Tax=Streptomyces sp. NPDC017529 TaxID=3365000 RepID=UPI00378988A9